MKPVVLVILDGFGLAPPGPGNAITQAKTPHLKKLFSTYPYTELGASGSDVGLPEGNQGTSEAGHITIGAGRVVYQPSVAIDREIADTSFFRNEVLTKAMRHVAEKGSTLHLMGLFSNAGVHAKTDHLYALLEMAKRNTVKNVALHLFLDGRDVPEKSALTFLDELERKMKSVGVGFVASIIGRYYAMDRDNNWDRTEQAYSLLVLGKGHEVENARQGIEEAYVRGDRSDYYVEPTVIVHGGKPVARIADDDAVIFTNFRSDRARQLTYAFTETHFEGFTRTEHPRTYFVGMSTYDKVINEPSAYPQLEVTHNLAQVLAKNSVRQFRTAETEKYAHVTFFFNSQVEEPVSGEERCLVHSPKVPSYDAEPAMNARGVTDEVLTALEKHVYGFIAMNFANADLVGHSANLAATIQAVEVLDACVGEIAEAVARLSGVLIITGDHGNAEMMIAEDGKPNPSHTTNPVPFVIVSDEYRERTLRSGGALQNIAPTILDVLHIEKPVEMSGKSLLI